MLPPSGMVKREIFQAGDVEYAVPTARGIAMVKRE